MNLNVLRWKSVGGQPLSRPPRRDIRLILPSLASVALCAGGVSANDPLTPEDIGNSLPLVVSGSNCGAGNDDILGCELGAQGVGEDYWYLWTSPITGDILVDVCDAAFDTILDVIDANSFISIACNDNSCGIGGLRSSTVASLSVGQAVLIAIDSWGGEPCGAFTLAIDEYIPTDCPPACAPVCPPGTAFSATVKSYQISGNANGDSWAWRLERSSTGETIAAFCNVDGVSPLDDLDGSGTPGLAGDVAYRFAESINDYAADHGCDTVLRAFSTGGTTVGFPAILSIQTSLPAADFRLLVGPAGLCADCAVVFAIPIVPCPFNPMIEELLLPGIDCDGNGWDDVIDIVFFGAPDDNGNGIPDVCEGIVGFGFDLIPFGGAALSFAPDTGNLSIVSPNGGGPAGFYINVPTPDPSGFWWNNPLLCLYSSDLFDQMAEGEGIAYKLGWFGDELDVYTSLRFLKEQQPAVSITAAWASQGEMFDVTIEALDGQALLSSHTGPIELYGGGPQGFFGSPKVLISPCALVQSVRYLPFWHAHASGFSRPWEVTFAIPTTVTMPDGEMVQATTLRISRHWPIADPTFSAAMFEINLPEGTTFELNGLATSGEQYWGTAVGGAMLWSNEVEDEQFLFGNFGAEGLDGLVLLNDQPADWMAFAIIPYDGGSGVGWGLGDWIDIGWWAPRGCCQLTSMGGPFCKSDFPQSICDFEGGFWGGANVGCSTTPWGTSFCGNNPFPFDSWDWIAWGGTLAATLTGTVFQPDFSGFDAISYSASAVLAGSEVASFAGLDGQIVMPLLSLPTGYRAELGTITMVWDASTPVQVEIGGVLVELDRLQLAAEDPSLPSGGIIGAQVLAANVEQLAIGRYPIACPADIDGDGEVTFADLVVVLSSWGSCPPEGACPADFNGDGVVDLTDLLGLLTSFGPCP